MAGLRGFVRAIAREEVARALAETCEGEEYLSTIAAGTLAGVAPGTIRRWVRDGRLAEHRAGRVVRVLRRELVALLGGARRSTYELSPERRAQRDIGCSRDGNG